MSQCTRTQPEGYGIFQESVVFPVTSGSKRRYKETEEGQQVMCEIMERLNRETEQETRLRINQLNAILIKSKRYDDLERTTYDSDYQEQLLIELVPEKV